MSHSSEPTPLRVRAVSELSDQPVEFLWMNWLPQRMVAIFDGDPGLGKSLIALDLCARLSTGRPMPDGSPGPGLANALVLNAEDGAESTIKHRLHTLGADRKRVFVVDRAELDCIEPVRLPSQMRALEKVVAEYQAKLLVIDPIMAFLEPRIQISNDQSVRQALYPLYRLADRYECAVLLIRHLNKRHDWRSCYRGGGSIGFQGACRCSWLAERDPDQPDRYVLAQVKNNVAPLQGSLAYTITRPDAPADGPPAAAAMITWDGSSAYRADRLLAARMRLPPLKPHERANEFLKAFLADGPRKTREIWDAAQMEGLTEGTLRRAKKELEIRTTRVGKGREHHGYWHFKNQPLPDDIPPDEIPPDLSPWLDRLNKEYPPRTPLDEA